MDASDRAGGGTDAGADGGTDRPGADGAGARAYLGSFTSQGGPGIAVASVADTGALTVRHTTDALPEPSYLALSADGRVLYAVRETEDGAVAAFDVADRDRPPAALGEPVPVGGSAPTHLALAAGHLLTANYGSGSVSALPVLPGGALTGPATVLRNEGGGPNPERQEGPHAHAVLPDPSGRWALGVDLGNDTVAVYAFDGRDGAPRRHRAVPLRPGSGPRHLAFHPRGDRAYVINELDPTITVCRWDADTGTLEPRAETRLLPPGTDVTTYPSEVVIAPDGRFAWAANRGHDSIATLAVDPSGDTLELLGMVPCGGHWPRDLALGPAGRLYAANERSGDVTWFDVDPATGLPSRAGSITLNGASCVLFG